MPSKSIIEALNEYSLKFQRFTLTRCTIEWNSLTKQFQYQKTMSHSKIILWHLNMIISVDIFILGGSILLLVLQFFKVGVSVPFVNIIIILIIALICAFGMITHIIILLYGKDFIIGWNQLSSIEEKINQMGKTFNNLFEGLFISI